MLFALLVAMLVVDNGTGGRSRRVVLAWVPDPPRPERPTGAIRASARGWTILVVGLCVWEAVAFVLSTRSVEAVQEFPTVSILLDPFVQWPLGRLVFVGLWLLGGLGSCEYGADRDAVSHHRGVVVVRLAFPVRRDGMTTDSGPARD